MDSAALLRATERSANPDLIVQHDRLIEDQKEMKTLSGVTFWSPSDGVMM